MPSFNKRLDICGVAVGNNLSNTPIDVYNSISNTSISNKKREIKSITVVLFTKFKNTGQ